ncbi:unnamed protein product [Caenorhabditis sp. 36 PRJEB53466]|nr:unnamed protein product [Caenorhabditis sp. 36 PRJEB53466]
MIRRVLQATTTTPVKMLSSAATGPNPVTAVHSQLINRPFVLDFPQVSVPTFELSRRVGSIFAQSFYTLAYERIHSMAHFFADENWDQMENLAVKDTVDEMRIARAGISEKLEKALRFSPNDIILSFLHSTVISGKDVLKLSKSRNIGIYFTVVSYVRLSERVPENASITQLNKKYKGDVLVCNATFSRVLNPLETNAAVYKNRAFMDNDDGFDYLFKIVLVGDMGVGKTCVVQRFRNGTFVDRQGTTIGVDFTMKTLTVDGKRVKLQIWDTGGQERFRTITQSYYRSANGIVLCYDITCKQSFGSLQRWIDDVSKFAAPNVVKLLIGTKCDLENQRSIEAEEAEMLQRANGMFAMLETSAKENVNVENAFLELATILKRQYDQGVLEQGTSGTFQLGSGGTTALGSPWQRCCQLS